jgi:glycosyltransferase involved in cell wall biosynthesis
MKILLYSSVFYPSLGGIETITATLADLINQLGHKCIVVTETSIDIGKEKDWSFPVIRKPNFIKRLSLVRECDIVHSNGASLALLPFAKLTGKPFIWTHNGYQVSCVDGLGWKGTSPTPMSPFESLKYYYRENGLSFFIKEAIKLGIRRSATRIVDLNIACTNWVANRQTLSNQIVAYTPYRLDPFQKASRSEKKKYDFIFVGRLVDEKGVADLIEAFHMLIATPGHEQKRLAIVGSGPLKKSLENLSFRLGLDKNIFFLGAKYGDSLLKVICQSEIAVVPSVWEEPMGGVALELLAAGKKVIVSRKGGHAECIDKAGLTFENGDISSLFKSMLKMINLLSQRNIELEDPDIQIKKFNEINLTKKYIEIYDFVISRQTSKLLNK